jgi:hypothetical protein
MKRALVIALTLLAAGTASAQDKVPLKLDLPKPLFAGTPRPIQLPNLEPPQAGKRPDLMVPAGTVLLSKGKTVTSSDALPVIGELSFVTDGKERRRRHVRRARAGTAVGAGGPRRLREDRGGRGLALSLAGPRLITESSRSFPTTRNSRRTSARSTTPTSIMR